LPDDSIANKKLSRRSVLKWGTALAAAGVVGVGLGIGGELLTRSSTTSTVTTTAPGSTVTATAPGTTVTATAPGSTVTATAAGTTVTATAPGTTVTTTAPGAVTTVTTTPPPPATISYVPPLSPEIQTAVNTIRSNLIARRAGDQVYSSMCRVRGCNKGCAWKVHLNNGVITGVESDDRAHPNVGREDVGMTNLQIIQGNWNFRGCPKGAQFPNWDYDPSRVLYPMIRVDFSTTDRNPQNRGTSGYVRTDWLTALNLAASEMQRCYSLYGAGSILNTYNINPCSPYITRLIGNWSDAGAVAWGHCSIEPSRVAGWYEFGIPAYPAGSYPNDASAMILNSKLMVFHGCAFGTTASQSMTAFPIKFARERGVKTIVIETKYTPEAETLFDQVIFIRPGTDPALNTALCYQLFADNTWNQAFIAQYVEPTGFTKWQNYVMGTSDGIPKTPQWAETITAIPAATITALAQLMWANAPNVVHIAHAGSLRKAQGSNDARTSTYLTCMLGSFGAPGGWADLGETMGPGARSFGSSRYEEANMGNWGPYRAHPLVRGGMWPWLVINLPKFWAGAYGDPTTEAARYAFDQEIGGAAGPLAGAPANQPTQSHPYALPTLPPKIGMIFS